jgi:anti-anti-sigma factor
MVEMVPLDAVRVDREDGVWVVSLLGEHDFASIEEFRATLEALFAPETASLSRPTLVVVDLTSASFFDSATVNAIVRAHDIALRDPDARFAVVVESPECFAARVFRVLGLTRVIPTFISRPAAVRALSELATGGHGLQRQAATGGA